MIDHLKSGFILFAGIFLSAVPWLPADTSNKDGAAIVAASTVIDGVSAASVDGITVASGGGGGGIALVGHIEDTAGGSGGITTGNLSTTGSDLIVIGVFWYSNVGGMALSDSASNTWTPLTTRGTTNYFVRLYYCVAPTTSGTHNFTWTGDPGLYGKIFVLAFSGTHASPYDTETGATWTSSTTVQPGSITPAVSNEVFVTIASGNVAADTLSIDSSFETPFQFGTNARAGISYKIKADGTAENPTWTSSGTVANGSVAMAAFKPS